MEMSDKLRLLYNAARDNRELTHAYIDYCNTHITGETVGDFEIRVERFRPARRERVFDVRNIPMNVFLDRVAEWLVTGEVDVSDSPADPLEW